MKNQKEILKGYVKGYETLIWTIFGGLEGDILFIRPEDRERIGKILGTLKPKQEKVVRLRFGLDGRKYTLMEIAQELGLSRARIHQIESNALRKLRHPEKKKFFEAFFRPALEKKVEYLTEKNLSLQRKIEWYEKTLNKVKQLINEPERLEAEQMSKSIEMFEFSVRTDNVLRQNRILTVGDLLSRTESELLLMKNMGRKSLNEIKETLASHGFKLKAELETDLL